MASTATSKGRRLYHSLALSLHPDKGGDGAQMAVLAEFHGAFLTVSEALGESTKRMEELDRENKHFQSIISHSRSDAGKVDEEWRKWHAQSLSGALYQRDAVHHTKALTDAEIIRQLHVKMRSSAEEAVNLRKEIEQASILKSEIARMHKAAQVEIDRVRIKKDEEHAEAHRQRGKRKEAEQVALRLLHDNEVFKQRQKASDKKIVDLGKELYALRSSKAQECKRLRSERDKEEEYANRQRKKRRDAETKVQELMIENPWKTNTWCAGSGGGGDGGQQETRVSLLPRASVVTGAQITANGTSK